MADAANRTSSAVPRRHDHVDATCGITNCPTAYATRNAVSTAVMAPSEKPSESSLRNVCLTMAKFCGVSATVCVLQTARASVCSNNRSSQTTTPTFRDRYRLAYAQYVTYTTWCCTCKMAKNT